VLLNDFLSEAEPTVFAQPCYLARHRTWSCAAPNQRRSRLLTHVHQTARAQSVCWAAAIVTTVASPSRSQGGGIKTRRINFRSAEREALRFAHKTGSGHPTPLSKG
jgi:hypothetical protein